jgi:hypothetical protein
MQRGRGGMEYTVACMVGGGGYASSIDSERWGGGI